MRLPSMSLRWRFVGLSQLYFCGHYARQSTLLHHYGLALLTQRWAPSFTNASRSVKTSTMGWCGFAGLLRLVNSLQRIWSSSLALSELLLAFFIVRVCIGPKLFSCWAPSAWLNSSRYPMGPYTHKQQEGRRAL